MKKYLYLINYPILEKDLALLEVRYLFKIKTEDKTFISEKSINPSDSAFIKSRMNIIYEKDSFQDILLELENNPIKHDRFKVEYMRLDSGNISYDERLEKVKDIGLRIIGTPEMYSPNILFGLTFFNNKWIFGIYEKNCFLWNNHIDKPHSYSQSLGVKLAKSVLNVATCGDKNIKVIDTCCGAGTIAIEALFMGIDISAYEINPSIAEDANNNLIHYGYSPIVINDDMHNIEEKFDSSILDIPYGIFSHITKEEQQGLINKATEISNLLILISFEELDFMVEKTGFKIVDRCTLPKGKFKRYIYVCKK